jgi:hypothetical protein
MPGPPTRACCVVGGKPKQKNEPTAGRRFGPEAVTEHEAGYRQETLYRTRQFLRFLAIPFTDNRAIRCPQTCPALRPAFD